MAADDSLVVIGTITRPHSLHGEVRVRFYSDEPDRYAGFERFLIRQNGQTGSLTVESVRRHQDVFLFRFAGYPDRTAVERLRGIDLHIQRSEMKETGEDEYYFTDLEGLRVLVSETGEPFGTVEHVFESGANAVLTVRHTGEPVTINVPFISDAVDIVSIEEGYITVKELFLGV